MKSQYLAACLAISVVLSTLGCAGKPDPNSESDEDTQLSDPKEEKANDSGTYSVGEAGYWVSYNDDCPVTESDKYKEFYRSLKDKGITVFPGAAKDDNGTTYHLASRDTIGNFFQNRGVSNVHRADQEVDLQGLEGVIGQWGLFERGMSLFSDYLKANPIDSGYALMAEYVVSEDRLNIHIVQCYILDSNGEDAFSFLLNSHHKLFVDTRLWAGAESRDDLSGIGADAIIKALQIQFDALSKTLADNRRDENEDL